MQVALNQVSGVRAVHLDLIARKAIVQVEKGEVEATQLVDAVADANGMHAYSATLVHPLTSADAE